MKDSEHIACDLDGTLAVHTGWKGKDFIGDPVPEMMDRVKSWLKNGVRVSIFTARANEPENIPPIKAWLEKHLGQSLPVTSKKKSSFTEFWDDRAVTVQKNTGRILTAGKKARRMAVS